MANRAVITLAPFVLERDDLLVLALFENFSSHLCSGDQRVAVGHVLSVRKHQHVTERRGLAGIDIENIDVNRVPFRDAKLPATRANNCVSHMSFGGEKAAQNSTYRQAWQTETKSGWFAKW